MEDLTTFTIVDTAVFMIIALSALISVYRGFVKELLSMIGMVASSILTMMLLKYVVVYVQPQVESPTIAAIISAIGLFITISIIFAIINSMISGRIRASIFSGVDRYLGLLFGLLRGAFLAALLFTVGGAIIYGKDVEKYPDVIKKSRTLNGLIFGSDIIKQILPNLTSKIKEKQKDAEEKAVEHMLNNAIQTQEKKK